MIGLVIGIAIGFAAGIYIDDLVYWAKVASMTVGAIVLVAALVYAVYLATRDEAPQQQPPAKAMVLVSHIHTTPPPR